MVEKEFPYFQSKILNYSLHASSEMAHIKAVIFNISFGIDKAHYVCIVFCVTSQKEVQLSKVGCV